MTNDTAQRDEGPTPGVYGLDCGQADAHLIITPNGTKGLIDADKGQVVEELNEVFGRTNDATNAVTLDFLHTTHIHDDHVFGVQKLKDAGYVIEEAYQPPLARFKRDTKEGVNTDILGEYHAALSEHGIEPHDIQEVTMGDEILHEDDISLTAISPPATSEPIEFEHPVTGEPCEYGCEKANPNSAACRYDGPHNSYLFMADIENVAGHDAEAWLIKQHQEEEINLDADVLVAAHHGSKNATDRLLLDTVAQDWTMIFADSTYHPATETLKDLQAATDGGVSVTGTHGRTVFTSELPPTPANAHAPTEPWRIDRKKHASAWSGIVEQQRDEIEAKNETIEDQQETIEEKDETIEAYRAESERSFITRSRDRLVSVIGRTEPSRLNRDSATNASEGTDTSAHSADTQNDWGYTSQENVELSKGEVGGNAEEDASSNAQADTSIDTAESNDVRSNQDDPDEHLGEGSSA